MIILKKQATFINISGKVLELN